jgi:chromosome segregation ATPase
VIEEPASLILELLREMRAELATKADLNSMRSEVGVIKSDMDALRSELKSDMHTLRADVATDILSTRKELGEQIMGLRRAVMEYHTSVIGHGSLISELEARVRRVEQHLNLSYPT